MSIPLAHDRFGMRRTRPRPPADRAPRRGWSRAMAIGITVIAHVLVVAALIAGVQSVRIMAPPALTIHLEPQKIEPPKDEAPPPILARPAAMTAPIPQITIRPEPSTLAAAPPQAAATPAAPVVAPSPPAAHIASETRENFLGRLLSHLNRFKRYPRAARQAHIEGVVMLHFVMNGDGKVISYEIAKSSGRPLLDNEALALIQRAQPLPAIPQGFPTPGLDALVPIEFSLQS